MKDRIFYRSGWERKVMVHLDNNINILEWSSEEIRIPYLSPIDERRHIYFPDFWVKMRTKDGTIKIMIIEVKPKSQTKEPVVKKRVTKRYIYEVFTWGVNSAKWKAAEEFCKTKGWEFKIMTETDLGM